MPRKCRTGNVIYSATVTTDSENKTYVELTAGEFKTRYTNTQTGFHKPNLQKLNNSIYGD
jgi:hypothetical protein